MSEIANSTHRTVETTSCPFAKRAEVIHASVEGKDSEFEGIAHNIIGRVHTYIASEYDEDSDGLFVEAPAKAFGETIDDLAHAFMQLVDTIAKTEGEEIGTMLSDVETPNWQLTIRGVRFFTIVFSPIYDESHPRHSPDPDKVQLFLQPESSFSRHIKATDGTVQNLAMKQGVRRAFEQSGRPYDHELAASNIEAEKYIKPQSIGQIPVLWWNSNL